MVRKLDMPAFASDFMVELIERKAKRMRGVRKSTHSAALVWTVRNEYQLRLAIWRALDRMEGAPERRRGDPSASDRAIADVAERLKLAPTAVREIVHPRRPRVRTKSR
jgi:hypothetical protein